LLRCTQRFYPSPSPFVTYHNMLIFMGATFHPSPKSQAGWSTLFSCLCSLSIVGVVLYMWRLSPLSAVWRHAMLWGWRLP
jgi:hypothetical protein